jgi:hypothetical protein
MRNISWMTLVQSMFLVFLACQQTQTSLAQLSTNSGEEVDDYSVKFVHTLFEQPKGVSISWIEKRQARLGDKAGIALLKLFSEEQLLDPHTLGRSLEIIRGAFAAPCIVEISDRQPKVTLFVLGDLARQVKDQNLKRNIADMMTSLKAISSTSCP